MMCFFEAYHCQLKPQTDSDSISVSFSQKLTMMTQYQCQWDLSLSVLAKKPVDVPRGNITLGFFKNRS